MVTATHAVLVIAEAGVNHNGELALALRLCDAAREAGADAVKFQTFRAQDLVLPGAPTAAYQVRETGERDQFELLRALELGEAQHRALKEHCATIGIEFFSTPFSTAAVDMLVALGVVRIKLGSGELTHRALVEHASASRLPLLLSTGMATMDEIRAAVGWVQSVRGSLADLTLLHCTSAYPAADEDLNLRAITTMVEAFDLPIGYSDHSRGIDAAPAAVALGARVIEKHLTLDRTMRGPDHAASLEREEFAAMVRAIRRTSAMLGDGRKVPTQAERDTARVARRSIVAACDIDAGQAVEERMLAFRRPATGIVPADAPRLVGCVARVAVGAGTVLQWDQFDGGAAP